MVETVWGLCRKSKWVRMATCYVFYLFIARWGRVFTQREWGGKVEKRLRNCKTQRVTE